MLEHEILKAMAERLRAVDVSSYDNTAERLSAIGQALVQPKYDWTTKSWCEELKSTLLYLVEQCDPSEWAAPYLNEAGLARLPKGNDGKPICVGDVVYGEDGKAWFVDAVTIGCGVSYPVHAQANEDVDTERALKPEWLTHERPTVEGTVEGLLRELREGIESLTEAYAERIRKVCQGE